MENKDIVNRVFFIRQMDKSSVENLHRHEASIKRLWIPHEIFLLRESWGDESELTDNQTAQVNEWLERIRKQVTFNQDGNSWMNYVHALDYAVLNNKLSWPVVRRKSMIKQIEDMEGANANT